MKKKIIVIILCIILISLCALSFCGCIVKASWFSEEYHIKKVSEKIQEKYIDSDFTVKIYSDHSTNSELIKEVKPTSFEIYPIYNIDEQLTYFLIEFEPWGHMYVKLKDPSISSNSLYRVSAGYTEKWSPCTLDPEKNTEYDYDLIWELDENGEKVVHYRSPYYVRGIKNEKRYIVRYECYDFKGSKRLIPAVKMGDKYVNLYANTEFTIENGRVVEKQATCEGINFIVKSLFDL